VLNDVESGKMVFGVPARVLGERTR